MGLKSYMPAFWALPSLLLTEAAAAGSIGLINSVGNLGGFVGPSLLGFVESRTNSFVPGILYLCFSMVIAATIIFALGLGYHATELRSSQNIPTESLSGDEHDALIEPV